MSPWPMQDPEFFINRLQDEMGRLVERVWHGGVSTRPFDGQEWAPAIDMYEHPERYVLYVEVPGVHPNEIDVSHAGSTLTLRGRKEPTTETSEHVRPVRTERRFGSFCRTLDLPADVEASRLSARCTSGVLEISLPKTESSRPRSVRIDVEGA